MMRIEALRFTQLFVPQFEGYSQQKAANVANGANSLAVASEATQTNESMRKFSFTLNI